MHTTHSCVRRPDERPVDTVIARTLLRIRLLLVFLRANIVSVMVDNRDNLGNQGTGMVSRFSNYYIDEINRSPSLRFRAVVLDLSVIKFR